jgi:hypothetical protein
MHSAIYCFYLVLDLDCPGGFGKRFDGKKEKPVFGTKRKEEESFVFSTLALFLYHFQPLVHFF